MFDATAPGAELVWTPVYAACLGPAMPGATARGAAFDAAAASAGAEAGLACPIATYAPCAGPAMTGATAPGDIWVPGVDESAEAGRACPVAGDAL
nr:hypothetical protein GCM10010200_043830 [Actinomadura rugatobispora]